MLIFGGVWSSWPLASKTYTNKKWWTQKKWPPLFSGRKDRVESSDVEPPMVHVIIKKIASKKAFCPSEARLIQSMPSSQNYSPSLSLNNPPNKALLLGGRGAIGWGHLQFRWIPAESSQPSQQKTKPPSNRGRYITNPNNALLLWEIPQNYHRFAACLIVWFPQNGWHSMTPAKCPLVLDGWSQLLRSIFKKFLETKWPQESP